MKGKESNTRENFKSYYRSMRGKQKWIDNDYYMSTKQHEENWRHYIKREFYSDWNQYIELNSDDYDVIDYENKNKILYGVLV